MKIRISGNTSEVGAELKRIRGQLADPEEVLREIGDVILDEIARCFKEGRAPDGRPWKRSHRAERDNGLTLVDRGILRSSFSMRVLRASVEVGTGDERAPTHQFGLREGNIPARPFMPDPADLPASIERRILRAIRRLAS